MIKNEKIYQVIKESLQLDESNEIVNESLVAQYKQYHSNTEFLSAKTKSAHKELYENYVDNFNRISAELDSADRASANSTHSQFRTLKIDESFNLNQVYLHELYFANIGDVQSQITMDSLAFIKLARDWGSFDNWQTDFIASCKSSRCGWAITYYNLITQSYMNCVVDLACENMPVGCYPIIVMDMWQHAYYKDYVNDTDTYITAMMKELNWRVIEDRIKKAEKIAAVLK